MQDRRLIFHFKEFSMRQADSGQRINTDSCVFGDCLRPLPESAPPPSTCLDIGCGTGLLAIMLAAKFPTAKITALEPATEIAAIARENAASCPWHDRIHVEIQRLQEFSCPEQSRGYDLIACNPPFFQNSQISSDTLRAIARHDVELSATDVGTGIARLLAPGGTAWLLCATADESQWIRIFEVAGLCQAKAIQMKDHPDAKAHATAIAFHHRGVNSKNKTPPEVTDTITYRDAPGGGYSGWMQRYRQRWHPF
jgi:tRNA1Val (adenine37-N6)-methyltransferase